MENLFPGKRGLSRRDKNERTVNVENEKLEQNKELEMQLLIGPGFKLGFVPIFHFPVPHSPF